MIFALIISALLYGTAVAVHEFFLLGNGEETIDDLIAKKYSDRQIANTKVGAERDLMEHDEEDLKEVGGYFIIGGVDL